MSEEELPVLETFSAILLEEYLRLTTAACYIQAKDNFVDCKFKIAPEYFNQIKENPIQTPLIGLDLHYDEGQEVLTITCNDAFRKMYENKIQEEVALNFAAANKTRYSKYVQFVAS